MKPAQYLKAIIAIVGAGITAALGIVSPDTDLFSALTIAAAVLTAAGVYFAPNDPMPGEGRHIADPEDGVVPPDYG